MKIYKSYKYRLKPNRAQIEKFIRLAGCCRFVWNRALALIKYNLDNELGYLSYYELCEELTIWKKIKETVFLKESCSDPMQQALRFLDRACKRSFKKKVGFPKFKKKGGRESFRFTAGIKIDGPVVKIPTVGWVKFIKSREMDGLVKNVTVSLSCGNWYISFQTESERHIEDRGEVGMVGVDLGVTNFMYLSNGDNIKPLASLKFIEKKLAKQQRRLARKKKFSYNWKKQKNKISRLYLKIANCRKDFLQKNSTILSKNHAMIVLEDLKVSNMSKSAKGTIENPGKNVKAKSGLNRSILDQGWGEFRRMLEYKQLWSGGKLVLVDPKNTSRKCSKCGHVSKDNRKSQSAFSCVSCGHEINADYNAAINILEGGQSLLACGDIKHSLA